MKTYKMRLNGMTGRIKKTEHVQVVRIEYGIAEVVKPGTDVNDFAMTEDLELVQPEVQHERT